MCRRKVKIGMFWLVFSAAVTVDTHPDTLYSSRRNKGIVLIIIANISANQANYNAEHTCTLLSILKTSRSLDDMLSSELIFVNA